MPMMATPARPAGPSGSGSRAPPDRPDPLGSASFAFMPDMVLVPPPRSIRKVSVCPHGRAPSPPAAASQPVQGLAPRPLPVREDPEEPSVSAVEGVIGMAQRDLALGTDPQLIVNHPRIFPGR